MKPAARLILDGRDISTEVFGPTGVLVSLSITDETGNKSDTLELVIDDREYFKAPPKGAEVQVWLGYEPAPTYMGRFKVDEWSKSAMPRQLRVSAKGADMTSAIRAAKSRSFDGKTVQQITAQVAGDHGLTPIVDPRIGSISLEHIDQQNESDLSFLTRVAKRVGASFKLADGKAVIAARGGSSLPSGGEKTPIVLTPEMVSSWEATSGERGGYDAVVCTYIDHAKGERVSVTAGSGETKHRDRRVYRSEAEAKAAAEAQLGDSKRGKISMTASGPGLPDVFAEGKAQVQDFDPDVDGEYRIRSVTHTLDSSGYRTDLSLEIGQSD